MLLQKWPDKTRFKPTLFHIFLPLNVPDCEKVPFATLFWSTYVQHQSGGLAEQGQEEEEENERHLGYILCLGYLATID